MEKKERTFCWMSVCLALALTAIVYAPMFRGKIPFPADFIFDFPAFAPLAPSEGLLPHTDNGDLVTSFYPYRTLAARTVRQWTVPLWNPYMLSGAPFLAMAQSAIFYPANFLYYILPVPLAWSIGFVLRRVLAAFFAALFVRRIGATSAGAIAAGLIFAFCGFLTAWQGQGISDAAIWLPLICYSVVCMHASPSIRWVVLAAFAFAMPVLAGHPETAAHLTLTGLAFAIFLFLAEARFAFMKAFTASGLLAIGLAAVQIIPTLEWLQYIHHPLKPWSDPPLFSMLGLISRDIIRAKTSIGLLMPEQGAYLAMFTFIAAPIAFLRTLSRRFAVFFAFVTAAAISAAYGIGPAHWIVQRTPVLSMLKNGRLILVAGFALAVLAGLGISAVEEFEAFASPERRFRAAMLGLIGFSVAFMMIYVAHLIPVPEVIEFTRVPRFGLFLLLAAGLTTGLKLMGRLTRRGFAYGVIAMVTVDLATVSYGAIPFTKPADVFPPIPLFERLPKGSAPPSRIAQMGYAYGANFEMMYGHAAVGGYEVSLERFKNFVTDLSPDVMDSVMLTTKGVLETKDRRLDMLNAKYYIVSDWDPHHQEFRSQPDRFRFSHSFGATAVYENLRALPPAFLVPVSGVEVIPDEREQLQRVKDPNFDPERHVILAEAPLEAGASASADIENTPKLEWVSWHTNDFEINVTVPEPSVLIVSQMSYPGWKASLDGRVVPIRSASYALPSIVVSPGSHHVRVSFEPWTFKWGVVLSLLAVLTLAVMVLHEIHRSNQNCI